MKKYYKVLSKNGTACHGGTGQWSFPKRKRPGVWMPKVNRVVCCESGYHLVAASALLDWLDTNDRRVFLAEGRGESAADGTGKCAFAEARLVRELAYSPLIVRHFAADCAIRVLPLFKRQHPSDDRPRKAIQAARDFADGKIDTAARAAAGYAAWDAARAAAGYAARTAVGDVAEAAARAAAEDAVRAAAGAAAWDAAWDAAWAAAWDAARAMAWAAARDAAGDAARDAAWDAERHWQTRRLLRYLNGRAVKLLPLPPIRESW